MEVVERAKQMYTKTAGKEGKAQQWITAFASRVTYYSDVLDMLAQHHPEYVALAWGAMKFVFVVCRLLCCFCRLLLADTF